MCNGLFRESVERQIELPDDDAKVFGYMLKYMYCGVLHGFETCKQDIDVAMLADVYILAEKYQLKNLKELLITKMAAFVDAAGTKECTGCVGGFFDAAVKIYQGTPDSEVLFPNFFKTGVIQLLGDELPGVEAHVKRCIIDGGKFAQDAFDAYCTHTSTKYKIKNEEAERAAVAEAQFQRKCWELRKKYESSEWRV